MTGARAGSLSLFAGGVYRITVPYAPRTKKTSNRVVPIGKGDARRDIVLPSKAWSDWCRDVQRAFTVQGVAVPGIDFKVNCTALFYREKDIGDACAFYQGLADVLEKVGVVRNDRFIVSWNGSELRKDSKFPRTEVTLTAL